MTIESSLAIQVGSGDYAVRMVQEGRKRGLVVKTDQVEDAAHIVCLDYTPLWNHRVENSLEGRFFRERELARDVDKAVTLGKTVMIRFARLPADQMPR